MSMTYVHSQHMEGAGWWGKWWENRRKPKSATGYTIVYTENREKTAGQRNCVNYQLNQRVMVGSAGLEPATSCL